MAENYFSQDIINMNARREREESQEERIDFIRTFRCANDIQSSFDILRRDGADITNLVLKVDFKMTETDQENLINYLSLLNDCKQLRQLTLKRFPDISSNNFMFIRNIAHRLDFIDLRETTVPNNIAEILLREFSNINEIYFLETH